MTEQEWLAGTSPLPMLRHVRQAVTPRKAGLFALALLESAWNVVEPEVRELAADPERGWLASWDRAVWALGYMAGRIDRACGPGHANAFVPRAAVLVRDVFGNPWRPVRLHCHWCGDVDVPRPVCARCGIGFGWLPNGPTPHILTVARHAYEDRDFVALPVLADALEDAGCEEQSILRHLRGEELCPRCLGTGIWPDDKPGIGTHCDCPCGTGWVPRRGPHVCGCLALDAVLSKE